MEIRLFFFALKARGWTDHRSIERDNCRMHHVVYESLQDLTIFVFHSYNKTCKIVIEVMFTWHHESLKIQLPDNSNICETPLGPAWPVARTENRPVNSRKYNSVKTTTSCKAQTVPRPWTVTIKQRTKF